jgi:type II restriction/modification system DNA methylase subunit YeeA
MICFFIEIHILWIDLSVVGVATSLLKELIPEVAEFLFVDVSVP